MTARKASWFNCHLSNEIDAFANTGCLLRAVAEQPGWKPELCRTAWWRWEDSNQPPTDYEAVLRLWRTAFGTRRSGRVS